MQGTVFLYRFIERHQSDVIEKIVIRSVGARGRKSAVRSNDLHRHVCRGENSGFTP